MAPTDETESASTTEADEFEPCGNFRVNFRRLGQRLAALHDPSGAETWPYVCKTPGGREEREAIYRLAREHFKRHDMGNKPEGPQCSDHFANPCRALGAAQVILSLQWAPGEEQVAEPARRLDEEARRAESALSSFLAEAKVYLEARAQRHAKNPWSCVASHSHYCEMPAHVFANAEQVLTEINVLRKWALLPQFPKSAQGSERLGLLKEAEAHLHENGWDPDEIISVLDDGNGGIPRARKDRLRKRREPLKGAAPPQPDPSDPA